MTTWEYAAGHDPISDQRLILRRYIGIGDVRRDWHLFATLHTTERAECHTAVDALNAGQQ